MASDWIGCIRNDLSIIPGTCSYRSVRLRKSSSACPVQVLWARRNGLDRWYDVPAVWREWADEVEGHSIDCGHYLAEEAPDETGQALLDFLRRTLL